MNLSRQIQSLNRLLAGELGWIGASPRYTWKMAVDIPYLIQEGFRPASKLIVGPSLPNYVRKTWAERLGNVWVLAKYDFPRAGVAWDAPIITEAAWREEFGDEFQYPEKGQYYAVDGTQMLPGESPSEDETRLLIHHIKDVESAELAKLTADLREKAERPAAEKKKEHGERVDDEWWAFNNEKASEDKLGQSRGGSVSFGGV